MATSMPQAHYTEEEWRPSAGHRPLGGLPLEQLMLLHRHWIWANRQRELFEAELVAGRPPRLDNMAANAMSAMFLWYALLWSVIEGAAQRGIELRGRFAEDIESISDSLRRCRNAVFHISDDTYYDKRLFELMDDPDSAARIRRISSGFGRLFLEEFDKREIRGDEEEA